MKFYFDYIQQLEEFGVEWTPFMDAIPATLLLILAFPLLATISLLLWLETQRPSFKRRKEAVLETYVPLTRFEIARPDGSLGPVGSAVRSAGLERLPTLIDLAAGRVPLAGVGLRRPRAPRSQALAKRAGKDRNKSAA